MLTLIQMRRGLASVWTSSNPILADGELGYDKTSGGLKVGDGSTAWTSLLYVASPVLFVDLVNVGATAVLDMKFGLTGRFTFVLTAPVCTISVVNAVSGSQLDIFPYQDSSPPRSIIHPASVSWTGTGPPTLSTSMGGPDRFTYTVMSVDSLGNPTKMVGSLGFAAVSPPGPITPPILTTKRNSE